MTWSRRRRRGLTDYLLTEYRDCTNVGELVKDYMRRAGLKPWVNFMNNQRKSFINDLVDKGWQERDITAVCGNTEDVRKLFYYFKIEKDKLAAMGGAGGSSSWAHPSAHPFVPPFPPESDDSAEWQRWSESVIEGTFKHRLGLDVSAKDVIAEWESSHECTSVANELTSMLSTISDFIEGKISVEDAEKRIDDSSYRAMFFRDEYLKKGLHLAQEKRGEESPPMGDIGFEPMTPSLSI